MPFDITNKPQYRSKNGCIYLYDPDSRCWYVFAKTRELPDDIKELVNLSKTDADALKTIRLDSTEEEGK